MDGKTATLDKLGKSDYEDGTTFIDLDVVSEAIEYVESLPFVNEVEVL